MRIPRSSASRPNCTSMARKSLILGSHRGYCILYILILKISWKEPPRKTLEKPGGKKGSVSTFPDTVSAFELRSSPLSESLGVRGIRLTTDLKHESGDGAMEG